MCHRCPSDAVLTYVFVSMFVELYSFRGWVQNATYVFTYLLTIVHHGMSSVSVIIAMTFLFPLQQVLHNSEIQNK